MKEITIRVPDSMVPLIEEWVKHIPEIELASIKESGAYEIDEINRRMSIALKILKENKAIRYGYDYTWIMVAIGDGVVDVVNLEVVGRGGQDEELRKQRK